MTDLPSAPKGKSGWPWAAEGLPEKREGVKEDLPPIGIVTPSYNQGDYIEATIRSVLLQGYPNLEFYIIDGGSTDQTVEIIKKYERQISGWVSEKDRGQSDAINKGMARLQNAKWVNWINSDDILLPGALHAIGRWAAGNPAAVAVVGRGQRQAAPGAKPQPYPRRKDLNRKSVRNWANYSFLQPSCFFSLEAFRRVGGVNEKLHLAMDFELWVKLGEMGEFDLIEDVIAQDLVHPRAKTYDGMGKFFAEACEVLYSRGHFESAAEMIEELYSRYAYLNKLVQPFSENKIYRTFIRGWFRNRFAPEKIRKKDDLLS